MKRIPWREPAWHTRPALRLRFLAEIASTGIRARQIHPPRAYRGGFAVRLTVTPPAVDARQVTIIFRTWSPEEPVLIVNGPTDSPHRYDDGALCIWYPYDDQQARWLRRDGAQALLGHIIIHLIKEEWWRRTGEWVGAEAPHATPSGQNAA